MAPVMANASDEITSNGKSTSPISAKISNDAAIYPIKSVIWKFKASRAWSATNELRFRNTRNIANGTSKLEIIPPR